MLKLLADENFDNTVLRGLFRRNSELDIVRVQDVGLSGEDDPTVLEWAAQEGRVLFARVQLADRQSTIAFASAIVPQQAFIKL